MACDVPVDRLNSRIFPAQAASASRHHRTMALAVAIPATNRQMSLYMQKNGASPSVTLATDSTTDRISRRFSPSA